MSKRRSIDPDNYPDYFNRKENAMIIKLNNVRLAFPELFVAKTFKGEGKPAFSASFIFPKNHPQIEELENAVIEAADAKWEGKATAILKTLKASDKALIHDGNTKAYDGYAGNLYVSARNDAQPLVVDRERSRTLTAADGRPYAGCYVNASLEIYAQDNGYGKRINAKLRAVQFVKDGDAFAAGPPATAEEFDDLSVEEEALV